MTMNSVIKKSPEVTPEVEAEVKEFLEAGEKKYEKIKDLIWESDVDVSAYFESDLEDDEEETIK